MLNISLDSKEQELMSSLLLSRIEEIEEKFVHASTTEQKKLAKELQHISILLSKLGNK